MAAAGCVESAGADGGAEGVGATATLDQGRVASSPGQELAEQVEALLVGPQSSCKRCHTIDRQRARAWSEAMLAVEAACFEPADLTPMQRVDCLRDDPASGTSPFSAHKLGLYATGASQPQFAALFDAAYGPAEGPAQHEAFVQKVGMPPGGAPLSATDFATIKDWVMLQMPAIDKVFDGDSNPDPSCDDTTTTAELLEHIGRMKTDGWGARLAELATPMFGCGGALSPLECLAAQPDVTAAVGEPSAPQKIRQLLAQPLASRFWVRSSADGRYVGFGLNSGASIVDLTTPTKPIAVNASYDPYFFPSNDGFTFAGADFGIHACRQSLLADVANAPSPSISMNEPKCASVAGTVYQSVGSALDGARYFMTVGSHENDDGGNGQTEPLPANFGPGASTEFISMDNNGQSYQVGGTFTVSMPGEGDAMLSPSSLLVSTRFERANGQSAFRVRLVKAQGAGADLSVETPLVAQVCAPGSKASFSFDERFLVTHQYVDHDDPDQASLPEGSSNILLVDLKTGQKARITNMDAGRYAFSPHFRADGWLYFVVRDMNANQEYVLASDAALRVPE